MEKQALLSVCAITAQKTATW